LRTTRQPIALQILQETPAIMPCAWQFSQARTAKWRGMRIDLLFFIRRG